MLWLFYLNLIHFYFFCGFVIKQMKNLLFTMIVCLAFVPKLWSQTSNQNKLQQPVKVSKTGSKPAAQFPAASQFSNTKLTYNIIPAVNNTFCYDVLADGKIRIHQPSKPGLPGNEGFKTKAAAEKVAKLIITKIKKGEMPPNITLNELKKLNVL
jgi:hypothetical protein